MVIHARGGPAVLGGGVAKRRAAKKAAAPAASIGAAAGAAAEAAGGGTAKVTKVTPFQERLYALCKCIPAGKVATYGTLAALLNSAPRAVGQGMRRNPFAPVVPCHRVIAASLELGGFSGSWGPGCENVQRKRRMLADEGVPFTAAGRLAQEKCLMGEAELRRAAGAAGVALP